MYSRLPPADRRELEGHIQIFLAEKRFEGCGGQEITDEVRVLIAAQACLLLLHRDTDCYPRLHSILVYPSSYIAKTWHVEQDGRTITEGDQARGGESWPHGAVVLAWDGAIAGAVEPNKKNNLVIHEFAHQLDQEDGIADGAPLLGGTDLFADPPTLPDVGGCSERGIPTASPRGGRRPGDGPEHLWRKKPRGVFRRGHGMLF